MMKNLKANLITFVPFLLYNIYILYNKKHIPIKVKKANKMLC